MTTEEHAIKFAEWLKTVTSDEKAPVTVSIIDGNINYVAWNNQFGIEIPNGIPTENIEENIEEVVEKPIE